MGAPWSFFFLLNRESNPDLPRGWTKIEIDGAFAVVNADDFYGAESFAALSSFLSNSLPAGLPTLAMVGFKVGSTLSDSGPVSRALCRVDGDGRLEGIIEILEMWRRNDGGYYRDAQSGEVEVGSDRLVSMNMWGFVPELFSELECRFLDFLQCRGQESDSEFLVPDVIQTLVSEGRFQVEVLPHAGRCYGITYPEDRLRVAAVVSTLVERGEYPQELWA